MSGIEVAGLVLGALPLLISGIQIYHDGLVPIKIWLKYEGALERIMGDLRAEKIIYKMTCERLLSGLIPDEQLAILLAEPWGTQWKNPDLMYRLEERLQDAYPVYLERIITMKEITEELRVKLGLDENGKPVWTGKDRKIFKSEWKKISFSLSIGEHRELLQCLGKSNELLDSLTKTSVEFEPLRQERSRGCTYKALKLICEHAQNLYDALKAGWSCSCKSTHRASLKLENRSKAIDQVRADKKSQQVLFAVLFSSNGDGTAWNTEIKASEKQIIVPCQSIPVRISDVSNASSKTVLGENNDGQSRGFSLSQARSKISKKVNFSMDGGLVSTTIIENSSLKIQSIQGMPEFAKAAKIKNLCSEFQQRLAQRKDEEEHLGFLESNDKQFGIYNVQKQVLQRSTSLAEVFSGLTRIDQLQLAAMLASTLLQLQTTTWLEKSWGKEDIQFYRQGDCPLAGSAYVSKDFTTSNTTALAQHPFIRNEAIFALGVILIELSEGKPLETFREDEDVNKNGQRTFMTEYLIAKRLLKSVYQREGTRYGDAVRRCIHCEFDERDPDFTNDSFRRKYFDGVVSPLDSVCHDFSRA